MAGVPAYTDLEAAEGLRSSPGSFHDAELKRPLSEHLPIHSPGEEAGPNGSVEWIQPHNQNLKRWQRKLTVRE